MFSLTSSFPSFISFFETHLPISAGLSSFSSFNSLVSSMVKYEREKLRLRNHRKRKKAKYIKSLQIEGRKVMKFAMIQYRKHIRKLAKDKTRPKNTRSYSLSFHKLNLQAEFKKDTFTIRFTRYFHGVTSERILTFVRKVLLHVKGVTGKKAIARDCYVMLVQRTRYWERFLAMRQTRTQWYSHYSFSKCVNKKAPTEVQFDLSKNTFQNHVDTVVC